MRHCASSFLSPLLLSIFATRRTYVRLRVSLRQKSKVSNHFLWLFTEPAKIARNFRFAPLGVPMYAVGQALRYESKLSNDFHQVLTEFAKIARNFRFAPLGVPMYGFGYPFGKNQKFQTIFFGSLPNLPKSPEIC